MNGISNHRPCTWRFQVRLKSLFGADTPGYVRSKSRNRSMRRGSVSMPTLKDWCRGNEGRRGSSAPVGKGGLRGGGPLRIRCVEARGGLDALFVVDLESFRAFEFVHHFLWGESAEIVVLHHQVGDELFHRRHASMVVLDEVHEPCRLLNAAGGHLRQGLHYLLQELRAERFLLFGWQFIAHPNS